MSACSLHPVPDAPRPPIRVNGVTISRAAISREVQNHPAPTPVAAWRAAALALVLREALGQEARRLGIAAQPARDAEGRRETEEEARMRALVEREVAVPAPTEEECRRYYERNPARFRTPDLFEASHILFAAARDDAAAYELARLNAHMIIAMLEEDPDTFEELARLHSACPSGEVGGSLGQVTTGQTTPDFEAALRGMRPGEISRAPVETRYGVHVIRLGRRLDGGTLPFEAASPRIAAYLSEAVRRRAQAQYVARLLGQARIEGIEIPAPGALNVN
ncbi:peptidylprolyl isomerase [Methylobacterium sp. WSM2598]|uniref:peptidylprolyl isomerase n=1 Tax=Methylobacterium sp. WSM2598 TaxID=398261 RepID=UPI00036F07E4|nr:peptidylprolyl isomerase [Methylobacterium sp. WSM2598]